MSSTAFVFPGQGSQSVGMLTELASNYPLVNELFATVSERVGFDLWHLVQHGPEQKLNQTEHTQVAMLVADVAVYKVMQHQRVVPAQMMAGHSLGEYAALVCTDAISLADAAALVVKRGQLMQQTVPVGQGAMAAIVGLSDEQVQSLCTQASVANSQVSPANYNAIGQVVVAGHSDAVARALGIANEMGARMAVEIPVSVPCHCPLLAEAATLFAQELQNAPFQVPSLPVISNVDLSIYSSVAQIRRLLTEQLYSPVRWVETIQLMKNKGIDLIIECGPGKVLSGLVKRIDKSLQVININDTSSLDMALSTLSGSVN